MNFIKAPMGDIDKFICTKGVKASTLLSMVKGHFDFNDKYFILLDDELTSTNKESDEEEK
jgi:hypothetical protein